MGLSADITSAVTMAFDALGDLAKSGTVIEVKQSTAYDVAADSLTISTVDHSFTKSVLTSFSEKEIDGSAVRITDVKALIPAAVLNGYRPTTNDRYRDNLLAEYSIEMSRTVPGTSLWILQLRAI